MQDKFNRNINYLRISVTDRCNLRCKYCMPDENITLVQHKDILSFEEICNVVQEGVSLGIDKVRITGGEPLVKRDILSLVLMISKINGINDLSMTTNGVLLSKYAEALKEAGIDRLNVSLDTMDPVRYAQITGFDQLSSVLLGLAKAKKLGFKKIKLNSVVNSHDDYSHAEAVKEYADNNGFEPRIIKQMNISAGEFWQVEGGEGGNCKRCNRLRLSSDGKIFPCLFSDINFSVRELGALDALKNAINFKPESGLSAKNKFNFLGG